MRHDEIGRLAESFDEMRVSLNVARADLIRAERLGAIGKAASAVAHDFTQPLSAIAGAIGLLKMEGTSQDVKERCFAAIEGELGRLQRMKQEIVEFARGESSLDEADVKIDSFLENTVSALRPQLAQRDIRLSIAHGHSGEWYIDSYRLERVIENLVRNAAARLPGRGADSRLPGSRGRAPRRARRETRRAQPQHRDRAAAVSQGALGREVRADAGAARSLAPLPAGHRHQDRHHGRPR
jgi:signal transduction histidine kinase